MFNLTDYDSRIHARLDYFSIQIDDIIEAESNSLPGLYALSKHKQERIRNELGKSDTNGKELTPNGYKDRK